MRNFEEEGKKLYSRPKEQKIINDLNYDDYFDWDKINISKQEDIEVTLTRKSKGLHWIYKNIKSNKKLSVVLSESSYGSGYGLFEALVYFKDSYAKSQEGKDGVDYAYSDDGIRPRLTFGEVQKLIDELKATSKED